jgi:hypothetical protein
MFVMPSQAPAPAPAAQMRPATADVFYGKGAVEFGPGSRSMASATDFQGQKRQTAKALRLALDGGDSENRPEDAVEQILGLANRQETTVDDLMDIIGRG